VVAHDLRSPLGSILMQAALLRRVGQGPDRRSKKPTEMIERAANHMNRIVQDLLDVTSLEAGHLSIEQVPVSVEEVLTDFIEIQAPLAASVSLELRLELAPDLGAVLADRDRLLQVFENLVGNAIKFTRAGGHVTIAATRGDGEVLFSAGDTGAAIRAKHLTPVFNRFWQAKKRNRQGAGLGLPIVKGIVQAHGGRVWVESQEGVGSTFFFTFPLAQAEATAVTGKGSISAERQAVIRDQPPLASQESPRVVLVAEDDADVRAVLCETLERGGSAPRSRPMEPRRSSTFGKSQLRFLCFLDLNMPVMDGWAFLEERNRSPDLRSIRVVVISGEENLEKSLALSDATYVRKPIREGELLEVLEHMVH